MMPLPSLAVQLMEFRCGTCTNCERNGAIIVSFNSRADLPADDTCTVICGMAMSGTNDTGSILMAATPSTSTAMSTIVTAIGLFISCLNIKVLS